MLLRLVALALYIGAWFFIHPYIRDHPPRFAGTFVQPIVRLVQALLRMWGPLLWFVPGLLWIGMVPPLTAGMVVSYSLFIPLFIFLTVLWLAGVFPPARSPLGQIVLAWSSWALCLFILFITFFAMLATLLSAPPSSLDMLKLVLFFVFVTLPPVLAVIVLLSGAAEIIPLAADEPQPALRTLQLLTAFFTTFPKPTWMVEDGALKTQIKGNPFYGVGPGWVMTEPENIVILKNSSTITRIVGPGITLTAPSEMPHEVIDLRNQIRLTRTTAMTRDGIEISLPISSLFRVHSGNRRMGLKSLAGQEPWPFRNQRDVWRIALTEEVDPTGKTPLEAHRARPWDDIPLKVALNELKKVVPQYSLEDMYSFDATKNALRRSLVAGEVRETVKKEVEPLGFEILGGGVGNKVTPVSAEVIKQRVEAWKARWINKVLEWQNKVEVARLEHLTTIRSNARADVLNDLLRQTMSTLPADDDKAAEFVAYYLLENLIHMARNEQVQARLPESAIPTLLQLSQMAKGG